MHFRGVIWKIKSKSNFPVSFNLISTEMNLVGNYRTLRGLRTVNPEGLPSTNVSLVLWLDVASLGHNELIMPREFLVIIGLTPSGSVMHI